MPTENTMAVMQRYADIPVSNPVLSKDHYTEAEYLDFERLAQGRWEFLPIEPLGLPGPRLGIIRAMSGGTPNHSEIAPNLIMALGSALRGKGNRMCHVFNSNLQIHTENGLNSFPDVSIVCGKPLTYGKRHDIVTNPILLAEVLSPSTEAYNRGEKWMQYQSIPTLQHFLLISADKMHMELYTRDEPGWRFQTFTEANPDAGIPLPGLDISISLTGIYALVEFDDE